MPSLFFRCSIASIAASSAPLLVVFTLSSCGDDAASSVGAPVESSATDGPDGGKGDATPTPGRSDAGPIPDASTADLSCLGIPAPIAIVSGLPYAKVKVGASAGSFEGSFLLDWATTASTIDLAKFPSPGPAASNCDPSRLGELCSFAGFDFFGPWGQVSLITAAHAGALQAGILGTDFLSLSALTLDYAHGKVFHATRSTFCSADVFAAAGWVPLSSSGFYATSLGNLRPLGDVVDGAGSTYTVPNVPTVPLRVAGVLAHTQLDTGFDDVLVPFSINVNEALFDEIKTTSNGALVRAKDKDLTLSTCVGLNEAVEAYTFAPGWSADFMNEAGTSAKSFPTAVVFVKRTPLAAKKCGGIGTWSVPAAQVGASFFAAFGRIAFDPFESRVWVK